MCRTDPVAFVREKVKKYGHIFVTRVMNQNTVFVCSQKVSITPALKYIALSIFTRHVHVLSC